jgi:hypothetical protein
VILSTIRGWIAALNTICALLAVIMRDFHFEYDCKVCCGNATARSNPIFSASQSGGSASLLWIRARRSILRPLLRGFHTRGRSPRDLRAANGHTRGNFLRRSTE